ncbi:MAG: hypothetical protein HC812_09030 [Leptolyngbya sp. RL_3_1]|nr:hypothetical protein [Leptolyngbya sp. RL_3_1]
MAYSAMPDGKKKPAIFAVRQPALPKKQGCIFSIVFLAIKNSPFDWKT